MKFARVGGLSPVKYKKGGIRKDRKDGTRFSITYHAPPERHGIYAFIWPYIELFLVLWHDKGAKEYQHNGVRRFEYSGFLWSHIGQSAISKESWHYLHTDDLEVALKKNNIDDIKNLRNDHFMYPEGTWPGYKIAYGNGRFSKDHLEVFIPKKFMGKIR